MKKSLFITYTFICALLLMMSCASESESDAPAPKSDEELTIKSVSDTQWSYFSLTTGKVVGTSTFGSTTEDAEWQSRTDWDIALCGKYIRTNSGTSGEGYGGIVKVDGVSYDAITSPTESPFDIDYIQ